MPIYKPVGFPFLYVASVPALKMLTLLVLEPVSKSTIYIYEMLQLVFTLLGKFGLGQP